MLETYWAPRRVGVRVKNETEARAFAYLMGGNAMLFIAGIPDLYRRALSHNHISFEEFFWGYFFAFAFLLPLILYAISVICLLGMRIFGYKATGLAVRLRLFWCLFAIGPAVIAYGGVVEIFGRTHLVNLLGFLAAFWFLGLCILLFREGNAS